MNRIVAALLGGAVALTPLALSAPEAHAAAEPSHVAYVHKDSPHAVWGYSGWGCKGNRVTIHPGQTKQHVISIKSVKWGFKYKTAKGSGHRYYAEPAGICVTPNPSGKDHHAVPYNHYFSIKTGTSAARPKV